MSINIYLLVIIFVIQKQKVYILSVWQGVFNLFVPRPEDTILNTNVTVLMPSLLNANQRAILLRTLKIDVYCNSK